MLNNGDLVEVERNWGTPFKMYCLDGKKLVFFRQVRGTPWSLKVVDKSVPDEDDAPLIKFGEGTNESGGKSNIPMFV